MSSGSGSEGGREGKGGGQSVKWSEEEPIPPKMPNDTSAEPQFDLIRDDVFAYKLMKQLDQAYGTQDKSTKAMFMKAFEETQCPEDDDLFDLPLRPQDVTCDPAESRSRGVMDDFNKDWRDDDDEETDGSEALLKLAPFQGNVIIAQSNFIRRLVKDVKMEIQRTDCPAPHSEIDGLFEIMRGEEPKPTPTKTTPLTIAEICSNRNGLNEPEEKLYARLNIYRRAFCTLMRHFEGLAPILAEIQTDYETILSDHERKLVLTTRAKRKVHRLEVSLDKQEATARVEGFKQMTEFEKELFLLMRHCDRQDVAIRTMTDILERLETSLSNEHDRRRASEDRRQLMIVEMNDFRRRLGIGPKPVRRYFDDDDPDAAELELLHTDDPVVLRRALQTIRNNLTQAHHRITILEADYSDVIPRRDFDELKAIMTTLETNHAKLIEKYNNVVAEVKGMKDQIESLTGSRNKLQDLVTDLRKRPTPRPSWEKVAEHIEGGMPKWKSLIEGKSSAEIVPTLVQELTGKKLLGPPEFITPLGKGSQVPQFMKWDKPMRRRFFSRRDVIVIVQEIWQMRAERLEALRRYTEAKEEEASGNYGMSALSDIPEEMPVIGSFQEFFVEYLRNRFSIPAMRMEWAYNIVEACRNLGKIEPKLTQFLDILEGRLDEGVYHLFRAQVAKLRNAVIQKSAETGQPLGSIQFGEFGKLLRQSFGEKTEQEIKGLLGAASRQTGITAETAIVKYIAFFAMTDEGLVGNFVEEFAKQFEEDRHKYVYDVLRDVLADVGVTLSSAERENDPAGETDVSMTKVFSAFVNVDPSMPDEKLGAAMMWVFFGISVLPGAPPRGLRLVEFLHQQSRLSEFHEGEDPPEDDDDDFERAISDILSEKEADHLNDMTGRARRRWLRKKKETTLRTVVRRLKGGAFLRHGPRYVFIPDDEVEEEGEAAPKADSGVATASVQTATTPQGGKKHRRQSVPAGSKKEPAPVASTGTVKPTPAARAASTTKMASVAAATSSGRLKSRSVPKKDKKIKKKSKVE